MDSHRIRLAHSTFSTEAKQKLRAALAENKTLRILDFSRSTLTDISVTPLCDFVRRNHHIIHLWFRDSTFTDIGFCEIMNHLSQNEKLENLIFELSSLTDASAIALCDFVRKNQHIATLALSRSTFTDVGFCEMMNGLSQNKKLEHLGFACSTLTDASAIPLCDFVRRNQHITILSLRDSTFTDVGFCEMMNGLSENKKLEHLGFDRSILTDTSATPLCDFVRINQHITGLSLIDSTFTDVGFCEMMKGLSQNEKLIQLFFDRSILTDTSATPLCDFVRINQHITVLSLIDSTFTDVGFCEMMKGLSQNEKLIQLFFDRSILTDTSATPLCDFVRINQHITGLSLIDSTFTDVGFCEMMKGLSQNEKLIQLFFDRSILTDTSATALCDFVRKNQHITGLGLALSTFTDVGFCEIMKGLSQNEKLKKLGFSRSTLTDASAIALCDFVRRNQHITKLGFLDSTFTDIGFCEMMNDLSQNQTLEELIFVGSPLTDGSIRSLCNFVRSNEHVTTLWFRDSEITDRGFCELINSLSSNQILQTLVFNKSKFDDASILDLCNVIKKNKHLNHLSDDSWESCESTLSNKPFPEQPQQDNSHESPVEDLRPELTFSGQLSDQGSTLQHPGTDACVQVPAGALPSGDNLAVCVTVHRDVREYATYIPPEELVAGPVVECVLSREVQVQKPLTVCIPLSATPQKESDLRVLYRDGETFKDTCEDSKTEWHLKVDSVHVTTTRVTKFLVTINNTKRKVHDVLLTLAARKVSNQVALRLMEHINCKGKDSRDYRESTYPDGMTEIDMCQVPMPVNHDLGVECPPTHIHLKITDGFPWTVRDFESKFRSASPTEVTIKVDKGDVPTLDPKIQDSNHIYEFMLDCKEEQDAVSFAINVTLDYGDDRQIFRNFFSIFPQSPKVTGRDKVTGGHGSSGLPVWHEYSPGGQRLLSEQLKRNIYTHLPALSEILVMKDLWAKLKQYGVLDTAKIHKLEHDATPEETAERFLEYIRTGPLWRYHALIRIAATTHYEHVVTLLGENINFYAPTRDPESEKDGYVPAGLLPGVQQKEGASAAAAPSHPYAPGSKLMKRDDWPQDKYDAWVRANTEVVEEFEALHVAKGGQWV